MGPVVLYISPYSHDAAALTPIVETAGFQLEHCRTVRDARARLQRNRYSAILTEVELADGGWQDVLRIARNGNAPIEVIVTHAFADNSLWTRSLESGAFDVLVQPFEPAEVSRILVNAAGVESPQPAVTAAYFG